MIDEEPTKRLGRWDKGQEKKRDGTKQCDATLRRVLEGKVIWKLTLDRQQSGACVVVRERQNKGGSLPLVTGDNMVSPMIQCRNRLPRSIAYQIVCYNYRR